MLFDAAFLFGVLVFALLVHHTALSPESAGTRYILSDAQQLVTFAAALDHPEAFAADPVFSAPENFGWYKSIHVPLIRWLANGRDYGLAYEKLTGLHQFLHLGGFYLLGLCFLRQRWLAAVFAIAVSLEFWFGWGEYWGSLRAAVPLPRVSYTALFSLLCAAMLLARRNYRLWPPIFLGMGLLVYVHAISALGMGFAMWLGLCCLNPAGFDRARHIRHMLLAGLCFVLPAVPFSVNFLEYAVTGKANAGLGAEDLLFLRAIATYRIEEIFTRLGPQLLEFLARISLAPPILPLALAGVWATLRYGGQKDREILHMLALWTLGIALVVAAFAVDHEIARRLGRTPLEYDMVRAIRFIAFFCFIPAFLGFSICWERGILQERFAFARYLPACLITGVLVLFLIQGVVRPVFFLVFPLTSDRESAVAQELADAGLVGALKKHTPAGARIFLEDGNYLVRYAALRNLVFSQKDGVILLMAKNIAALRTWYELAQKVGDEEQFGFDTRHEPDDENKKLLVECAVQAGAEYLVVKTPASLAYLQTAGKIIWNNTHYIMLRLP